MGHLGTAGDNAAPRAAVTVPAGGGSPSFLGRGREGMSAQNLPTVFGDKKEVREGIGCGGSTLRSIFQPRMRPYINETIMTTIKQSRTKGFFQAIFLDLFLIIFVRAF